ncbi:MAG: DUF1028 domain-containing protein, partial [Saprospiraceae bacterium]|nr:DUF1028 domain-containing protein [Saprospiraceae bacterium]
MKLTNLIFSFFCLLLPLGAQHTFSIVAIDVETGKVGSAGATCLTSADCGGCGGAVIISDLVPGKGAINAQATVCIPNTNLNNGIQQLTNGADATSTLSWLIANDACQFGNSTNRQYGIVSLDPMGMVDAKGYTGISCLAEAGHRVGPNYSIQGNILIGEHVLDSMEANFLNASGSLEEKLMAAMQGANIPGADSRCLLDGISSKSSFL